jgi:transcriptional regulator with XRE-family HTH domain
MTYTRTKGGIALGAYMALQRMTKADMAKQLGVGVTYVYQLIQGRCAPSLHLAARIEELCGIPCAEWTSPKTSPSAKSSNT